MGISETSVRSGLGVDTIRFYEKSGMVPKVQRHPNGQVIIV